VDGANGQAIADGGNAQATPNGASGQATADPATAQLTVDVAQPPAGGGQATSGATDEGHPSTFGESLVFAQPTPGTQTPETAGVQTAAAAAPDRTAIIVQIAPQVQQMIRTIVSILPSTGGPSAFILATVLLVLGGLGVWLRHAGRLRG
jgi:hypothetical protein